MELKCRISKKGTRKLEGGNQTRIRFNCEPNWTLWMGIKCPSLGCLEQRKTPRGNPMIIIFLNCRGLASSPKKMALKEVIHNYNLDTLLLQEMLGVGSEVSKNLSKFMPRWHIQALDSKGRSGGLALGVKEGKLIFLNTWGLE